MTIKFRHFKPIYRAICRYRLLTGPIADRLAARATNWANTNTDDRHQWWSDISALRLILRLSCWTTLLKTGRFYKHTNVRWVVMITRWYVRRRLFYIFFLLTEVSEVWVSEGAVLYLSLMLCFCGEGLLFLLWRLRHVAVMFKPIIKLSAEPLIKGRSTCVSFVVRWFFICRIL